MKNPLIHACWLACLAACGCGTMYNNELSSHGQADTFRFYGGVRKDVEGLLDAKTRNDIADKGSEERLLLAGAIASFPLEFAMSAVGDTLFLPYTVGGMMLKPAKPEASTASRAGAERE
jgi:hypothetical protein